MNVVVPLALDPSEPGDSLCLEADVVQGESRIPDRRVTVSIEPGPSPGTPRVNIRSTVAIEEPVVTMKLRAGCEMRSTRTYVLLADVAVEPSLPGVSASGGQGTASAGLPSAVTPPPVGTAPRAAGGGLSGPARSDAASRGGRASPSVRTAEAGSEADTPAPPRRAAPVRTPRPAAVPAVKPRAAPPKRAPTPAPAAAAPSRQAAGGTPRLQVDALEPVPTPEAGLKTASQLAMPATEDPARRAEAAAQWRALNPESDPSARESERLKEMEATLAVLREQTAQNQRTLLQMQIQLAEARESRYRNPLVYALLGLLLIALVVMAMLWRMARRAAAPAWYGEGPASRAGAPRPVPADDGPTDDELFKGSPALRSANAAAPGGSTFAVLGSDGDSEFPDGLPARMADGAPVRPVNTEELFDVQQQSDFFLSLGQHDQAIAVLREHIAANPGTSALAYLDLLRIFHSLDRKEDYAQLGEEFERAFNATVPDFENFNESAGKGLEHYRSALARIESQWPAPGTLALIEELVFRKPGASDDEAFDLAAYQELLLLYSVAKEVIDPDRAPPAPVTPQSFVDTIGHEQPVTAPAALESPPEAIHGGPELAPSIYGAIDDTLQHQTVMSEPTAVPPPATGKKGQAPGVDLSDFDRTAFETMPASLESPKPEPSSDPHVIDFELFDPDTEADIAPRPVKR